MSKKITIGKYNLLFAEVEMGINLFCELVNMDRKELRRRVGDNDEEFGENTYSVYKTVRNKVVDNILN